MKHVFGAATLAAGLLCGTALTSASACQFANGIQHVVYLQFDNTHFTRDNPNVPSDIEQMPHLLNFIKQNGVLLSNDHTQLISHTSNGILTSETGAYPDRVGAGAIANSFNYYNANTGNANHYSSSFVYWTDQLTADTSAGADNSYVLINENGQNAPAPWVAYTRAGCDVGAAGIADIDLENTSSDLKTVYGPTSAEYQYASANYDNGIADFEGIALHCAQGSAVCAAANALAGSNGPDGLPVSKAVADVLPQEPNGYTGFQGIFGHRYLAPALQSVLGQTPNGQLYDYQGNLIGYQTAVGGQIVQADTISGFPGFDGMFPFVTLSYVETMLKAGVPVVYGYFSDAHDHHYGTQDGVNPAGSDFAYGPGEQGYTNQLQQYDAAWAQFFSDLNAAGINQSNTLFVILVEEGDQFSGGTPTPANCDGVTTACSYPGNIFTGGRPNKGEVDVNIDTLLLNQTGNNTSFTVHNDQAPAFYLASNPAPTAALTRTFEQDVAALTYENPYYKNRTRSVVTQLADQPELALLHMVTSDPLRTPTFVAFDDPDVYAGIGAVTSGYSNPTCNGAVVCTYAGYAWNHGGTSAVVRQTWTSLVGPGVNPVGQDSTTWTDHTDVRATMFALLGLQDDYLHDGRVIVEDLNPAALPPAISDETNAYKKLAAAYKQLNAPFGSASLASLQYATKSINSTSQNDATYTTYVQNLTAWTTQRNQLAAQIRTLLNNAANDLAFSPQQANTLAQQANALTQQMISYGKSN
jgi:hypothetical protein